MKIAIVTGANGFVGGSVTRELIKHDCFVYALDLEGKNNNIPEGKNCLFVPCSLSEIGSLKDKLSEGAPEIMYHFAWVGSAGQMRADTRIQLQNAQWTIDSMRIAKEIGCSRFVCAGSIMEHETIAAAFSQGNRPGLGYIYGSGKLVAHTMCMSVAADIGIDLIWAFFL